MTHHHHQEEKKDFNLYYIVGLLAGLFAGVVIDAGIVWILVLGVFGLAFTAFFTKLMVEGREDL